MKSFTNHTPGLRGINTAEGTVWIEPGQTVELDPKTFVGDAPYLGKPGNAPAGDDANDLKAQVADLEAKLKTVTDENAALAKERDDLKAQVAKFDPDGDGKPGGSKPKPAAPPTA